MIETLSNNISDWRQARNMTQEELALRVGVTRQTIIALEKGNYTPSLLLAFKLAHVFGKPIEKLFSLIHKK